MEGLLYRRHFNVSPLSKRERERERERERKKRQFAFARFEKRERAAPFVRREYILVKCKNQSCYSGKIISKITKRRKKK